jgi:hypothetical protein
MLEHYRFRFPAVFALLAQLAAAVLLVLVLWVAAQFSAWRPGLLPAAMAQGVLAAGIGQRLGLSLWWLPINLLFVPGLLLLQGQTLSSGWWFGLFLLVLLLNWNSFRERVPLYLSGRKTQEQLVELLTQRSPGFRFIDLGSGLSGTLCRLARAYPASRFEGVETAPLVFLLGWLRSLGIPNCTIRYRSLWKVDLADFDVVYCFLSPAPMPALWQKAASDMGSGSWLISNTFEIPGVPPDQTIELNDWRQSRLLLWKR